MWSDLKMNLEMRSNQRFWACSLLCPVHLFAKLGKNNSIQILYSFLDYEMLQVQHWTSKEAAAFQNRIKWHLNVVRRLAEDGNKTNQFNKLWSTIYERSSTSHLQAFVSSVVVFCYCLVVVRVCVCVCVHMTTCDIWKKGTCNNHDFLCYTLQDFLLCDMSTCT